ncbi:DUF3817 domain-containing protein [Paenibacillus sp. TRM 82003]|uniref:DUF3817 domain-containing protein n=1 Tax=Kineococcus sp. TRM81007 TaxID=2925831 RepID=UPI001F57C3C0|nr:DUF3817 domain-containing protein [Kineococcus sp. TRM81007]MCI2238735.1 DUF3817 domain-containing protein [Kineococcus sp. TRM81007]MCI3924142.1 DUF3817 domain-containing protein [Paenibacillus sp. TRM 82003]
MSTERTAPALQGTGRVRSALTRYRVMAWITGIGLLFVVAGMVQEYALDRGDSITRVMGPVHGLFYVLLLITTFDLGTRVRWPWSRMLLTALAGTVPFLSFYAERKNHRAVEEQLAGRPAAS